MLHRSSREIIIELIDNQSITGEEAFTLIQDLTRGNNYLTTTPINIPSVWTEKDITYPYKYEVTCSQDTSATTADCAYSK